MDNMDKRHYIMYGLFFSFIGLAGMLAIGTISGDDYWWHVKAGEWMVQNGQIAKTGIYSWFALWKNLPWFSHEWLTEVLLYGFYKLFGASVGPILFVLITSIMIFFLLYYYNRKKYLQNVIVSSVWAVMGYVAVSSSYTPRPHMIAFVFFIILLIACEKYKKEKSKIIYILPIVSVLWANFHGGSANLVYIIPIIFFATNVISFEFGKVYSKKMENVWTYIWIAIANFLALAINPRGIGLWIYPYSYSEEHAKYILEWQAPTLIDDSFIIVTIIILCLFMIWMKTKIDLCDLAITGAFILLTLRSLRFEPWLYIAASIMMFKYVPAFGKEKLKKVLSYEYGVFGALFLIGAIGGIAINYVRLDTPLEEEGIKAIKESGCSRICNEYSLGGYLIYNDIPSFIDGRADMYTGYNFQQYVDAMNFSDDYLLEDFEKEFKFDSYIIKSDTFLNYELAQSSDYMVSFKGEKYTFYINKNVKNTEENAF